MLTPVPPTACARARESASAHLDGELVELQEAQLEAHLRSCPECQAYAAEIGEISRRLNAAPLAQPEGPMFVAQRHRRTAFIDRKSTRLNSSHQIIPYAVFCLKKKKPTVSS